MALIIPFSGLAADEEGSFVTELSKPEALPDYLPVGVPAAPIEKSTGFLL